MIHSRALVAGVKYQMTFPLHAFAVAAIVLPANAQIALHADGLPHAQAQATRAIEIASTEAARLWSLDVSAVRADLTLHAGQTGYEAADQELTGGRFRQNGAFALGNQAHVLVQPTLSDERMRELGLPMQTLRLIGHETAHLVRNTLPNRASHPHWLADATGQLVSAHTARAMGIAPDRDADPWTSTQIRRLQSASVDGRMPSIEDLLSDGQGGLNNSERYAARWAIGAWLQDIGMLQEVLAHARRTGGGRSHAEQLRTYVLDSVRSTVISEPDQHFRAWIAAQPAPWDEAIRSLAVDAEDAQRWTQIAFPNSNAVAWTTASQPSESYTLRGRVRILPGERTQMNVLLARSETGFISIALTAGWGVTVFHYSSSENRWDRLAAQEAAIPMDKPVPFSVQATNGRIRVMIDGRQIVEAASPVPLHGPWGIGAQSGSAGIWQSLELATEP